MVSDIELRMLKEEAEEALNSAELLLQELDDIGMGEEMSADTLRWLISQVKSGMRRTGGRFYAVKKDTDAVASIGVLRDTVEKTRSMLLFF